MSRGTRILVIDDDEPLRSFMRMQLEAAGYAVLDAANGRKGLDVLQLSDEAVALVITDILMPERDGLEVTMLVRRRWPAVRIIATSEEGADLEFLDVATLLGAHGTLRKPFTAASLLETVRTQLEA